MTHVLQRLHDCEIRFEIYNYVPPSKPGIYWKLGCSLGQGGWADGWENTFDAAIAKLAAEVVKRYPHCEFSKEVRRDRHQG